MTGTGVHEVRGYELVEEFGSGRFGVVYRAHQPSVARDVAIKVIRPEWANDPEFVRRFEIEAELVAGLEHPYVVPLYDFWREPGGAYLAMRFMGGGSLRDALRKGPWSVERTSRLAEQIGTALAAAHRHNIVHRDLKPGNVLLDEEGNTYLSDFGIAKDVDSAETLTGRGGAPGSPAYMAPEQLEGGEVSPRTDVYAFGLVLYETLTGQHPFPTATLSSLVTSQLCDPVPAIDDPQVPAAVNDVIGRATAKNPAARYSDMVELLTDWRRALDPAAGAVVVGNLPASLSSFMGRDVEVDTVRRLVAEQRLVTLVGPGGVGKTRLAIETARGLVGQVEDGVWLVELAGIDDGDLVASQVAGALGVSDVSGEDLAARLVDFLRGREALLVVDNCEHLLESVAELVVELLTSCPELRALVTSRQSLGVQGEVTWRTEPLAVEPDGSGGGPVVAVELFVDRARAVQPLLEMTDETESVALEVCRRLAGLPLAIELAAAQLYMMSLRQIAQRLDDEFELLTGGPAQQVSHHQAMRATLDWSYRLLDPAEQALFRRLAVFRGGFTLNTAARFHGAFPSAEGKVLELVGRLVDASMLVASADDRYTMLEPIRLYGLVLLDEHGERATAHAGHAALYRELFRVPESVRSVLLRVPGIVERFDAEIDNVRAALGWALESGDTTTVLALGAVAGDLFAALFNVEEAKRWLDRVVAATTEPTPHRARALSHAIFLTLLVEGPDQAEPLIDELAATAEALDDERWRAAGIERRATLLGYFRDDLDTASRLFEEAAARLLRLDDPEAWRPLNNHMDVLFIAGQYERSDDAAKQMGDIGRRFDLPEMVVSSQVALSFNAIGRGDLDGAERHLAATDHQHGMFPFGVEEGMVVPGFIALLGDDVDEAERLGSAAVTEARKTRHATSLHRALVLAGLVQVHHGDAATAHRYLTEALREVTRIRMKAAQRWVLGPLAAAAAMIDPANGAVLLGAVEGNNRRDGRTLMFPIARAVEQATATLDESIGADELEEAWQRGAAMTLDDAIAFALQTT